MLPARGNTMTRSHTSRSAAALSLVFLLSATPTLAQVQQPLPALEIMSARLNLTAEQQAQIAPLLERRRGELQETRTRMTNLDSRSEQKSVKKTAKEEQERFNKEVESLLTPEQQPEWARLRDETRAKLKEYWNPK
jgi:hypothetical protein